MSEETKPERTVESIQAEYMQGCAKAGDMQYRINCFKLDLASLNDHLRGLNQEAMKLKQEADKVAAAPLTVVPNPEVVQ